MIGKASVTQASATLQSLILGHKASKAKDAPKGTVSPLVAMADSIRRKAEADPSRAWGDTFESVRSQPLE